MTFCFSNLRLCAQKQGSPSFRFLPWRQSQTEKATKTNIKSKSRRWASSGRWEHPFRWFSTCTQRAGVFSLLDNLDDSDLGSAEVFPAQEFCSDTWPPFFLLIRKVKKLNSVIGHVLKVQVQHQLGMIIMYSPSDCSEGDTRILTWLSSLTGTNVPRAHRKH